MKQIELREGARRQHRTVALFGMIQCWHRGLDAICYDRSHIERLVGIERFRGTRVAWLKEDLKEYFPYIMPLVYKSDSFASIFCSRVSLESNWPKGRMLDEKRASLLTESGVKCGVFHLWDKIFSWDTDFAKGKCDALLPLLVAKGNNDERIMNTYLDLLGSGVVSPQELIKAVTDKYPEPEEE